MRRQEQQTSRLEKMMNFFGGNHFPRLNNYLYYVLIIAITFFCMSETSGIGLDDVSFAIGFENGLKPDIAKGKAQVIRQKGKPEFVSGRNGGKALQLVNGKDWLEFAAENNLNCKEGTISFWLSADNWDGSMSDPIMAYIHSSRGDTQFVIQKYWHFKSLGMVLFRNNGQTVMRFPECRTVSASLQRANDLESVLKKGYWHHYAFTWRDGFIAAYLNGKRTAYSNSTAIRIRDFGDSFFLGYNPEVGRLFVDPGCDDRALPESRKPWTFMLDDITFFSSFVFDGQVEQMYKFGAMEFAAKGVNNELNINTKFYQTNSYLIVTLMAQGKEEKNVSIYIRDAAGNKVHSETVKFIESPKELRIDLSNLPIGKYIITAALAGGAASPESEFEKVKPDWMNNELGSEDVVLSPWTPVKVDRSAEGFTASVWGRTYHFDGPLASQISTQGVNVFKDAPRLLEKKGGIFSQVKWSAPEITEVSSTRVRFSSRSTISGYEVTAKTILEYDGMVWSEFDFKSGEEKSISGLRAQFPFNKEICKYMQYPTQRDCNFPQGATPWEGDFNGYIFVGNFDVGFQWFAESTQWWYGDATKALKVGMSKDYGYLQLNIVDDTIKMPKEFSINFGYMASPVRPRPDNWRGFGAYATLSRSAQTDKFTTLSLNYGWWSAAPGWVTPNHWSHNKDNPKVLRTRMMPFTSTLFRGMRSYKDEDIYNFFPLWRQFEPEWVREPSNIRYGKPKNWNECQINPSKSFCDRFCWEVNEFFKTKDSNGLYFDGYAGAYPSANTHAGFGYVDRDGSIKPEYPILAGRELMRRLQAILQKELPNAHLFIHPSSSLFLPVLSFSSCIYDGEFMGWGDILGAMQTKGLKAGLTDDKLRFLLNYKNIGLVPAIDSRFLQWVAEKTTRRFSEEEERIFNLALAYFMLADIHCFFMPGKYVQNKNNIVDKWGLEEPGVNFIPYWDKQPPVKEAWAGKTSAWIKKDGRDILLLTMNDSAYGRSDNKPYVFTLNLKRLGLTSGEFEVFFTDSDTAFRIPVKNDAEIDLTGYLDPFEHRFVNIRKK